MDVVVIGGGAAGMMAAINSAKHQNKIILIEKTSSLGNKIKITGKGRCNITFDGDIEDFERNITKNNKFMFSSFMNFSNKDTVDYFNSLGVKTKVERGGRIFPQSDRAEDVVNALKEELKRYNVEVKYNTCLQDFNSMFFLSNRGNHNNWCNTIIFIFSNLIAKRNNIFCNSIFINNN